MEDNTFGCIVALDHWGSSGFANTDLDLQLKKLGIHRLIVMRLIAHTCVEPAVLDQSSRTHGGETKWDALQ